MVRADLANIERVDRTIRVLRGQKVILDSDLAALYGVNTKRLNEQVKRNPARFPPDFVFSLTADEHAALRSQDATSKASGRGGRRHLPYAFTEHGAVMAASVLNSRWAIEMSVQVVRAFVRMRRLLANHAQLAGRLDALERKHASQDQRFTVLFDAIRRLMAPAGKPKRRIGFGQEGS